MPEGLYGQDFGTSDDGFTRNWQTFWGVLLTSTILSLGFCAIKHEKTRVTEDGLLNAALIVGYSIATTAVLNLNFGDAGFNPALSSAYILFETTQFDTPNDKYPANQLNHYLWVYILVSMVGGALGGVLHWIHSSCANSKRGSGDNDDEAG
mmetsp:Transcript_22472/g.27707  ORF Transcript_22472/g.27707 Transcript_22472/m.27707 type:complete len:151 (-) Transcript_22472:124-576(-)|eukprot:CAMPEP_0170467912 /NCGR_PEP_ID=MMETSP0123-20130129/11306_1 /TAXON_ID=182087 /ORGANISM="Favella ehrenbergii, Strain Fehren 1" /LENGTH=150 /DNA_ID=CAMNT_0010734383 /DNA_START=413 /DNA_END=865 /DNA_ORIENTATION=-